VNDLAAGPDDDERMGRLSVGEGREMECRCEVVKI
jgi:hypothetical protein